MSISSSKAKSASRRLSGGKRQSPPSARAAPSCPRAYQVPHQRARLPATDGSHLRAHLVVPASTRTLCIQCHISAGIPSFLLYPANQPQKAPFCRRLLRITKVWSFVGILPLIYQPDSPSCAPPIPTAPTEGKQAVSYGDRYRRSLVSDSNSMS